MTIQAYLKAVIESVIEQCEKAGMKVPWPYSAFRSVDEEIPSASE